MANEILVSALMDGDKVVVPQARFAARVKYKKTGGRPLTAAEYQTLNPPTLAELRHAYFDKNPDGSFVSPEYRLSVNSKRGYGEWTSTFLRDGNEIVERPKKIYFDEVRGLWIAEGGKTSPIKLPNDGWTLEYDERTGFPSETGSRKDAEKVFGEDTSYFYTNKNGLRAVLRCFAPDYGPFLVNAYSEPDGRDSDVGVRSLRRSSFEPILYYFLDSLLQHS
ncbi:MAG: hypothetical protein HY051_03130 [Candidatus Aenigmarchaeota archaeon]|nr:hypothetical protein [Candidatus Aenigmarchaeota archaeon]